MQMTCFFIQSLCNKCSVCVINVVFVSHTINTFYTTTKSLHNTYLFVLESNIIGFFRLILKNINVVTATQSDINSNCKTFSQGKVYIMKNPIVANTTVIARCILPTHTYKQRNIDGRIANTENVVYCAIITMTGIMETATRICIIDIMQALI